MNLIQEIEKNDYKMELSKNNAKCYQNIRDIMIERDGRMYYSGYLHLMCPPISKKDFDAFEAELGIKLNKDLIRFYKKFNGFMMFSGSFNIFGFGRVFEDGHYFVSRDEDMCLPYHLFNENSNIINEQKIKLGSLCDKPLYYNNKTGVLTYEDEGRIEQWQNLDEGIEDIYNSLYVQYLPNGVVKKPAVVGDLAFNQPEHFRQQSSEATNLQKN